jgi:hypothetical protein
MLQSSAYLAKRSPRFSSSLSSASRQMFAGSGGRGPPCGVPSSLLTVSPSGITTPARRNFPMSRSTALSLTTSPILCIRMSWFTRSKNLVISISTTWVLSLACEALGRSNSIVGTASRTADRRETASHLSFKIRWHYPWLLSLNRGSNTGCSTPGNSCWIKRSCTLGMLSGRVPPLALGMSRRFAAPGL